MEIDLINCNGCGKDIKSKSLYCGFCGSPAGIVSIHQDESVKEKNFRFNLYYPLVFYGALLIVLITLQSIEFRSIYTSVVFSDLSLIVFGLLFTIPVISLIKTSLTLRDISFKPLMWLVPLSVVIAVCVIGLSNLLNRTLFENQEYINWAESTSFPLLYGILSTAIQPAIVEEITFRGLVYTCLNEVMGWRSAVLLSAFMFALAHMSVISLFWLIPAGIFYGYLRYRYKTIWYGVAAHFIHNSTVVIYELYIEGSF